MFYSQNAMMFARFIKANADMGRGLPGPPFGLISFYFN